VGIPRSIYYYKPKNKKHPDMENLLRSLKKLPWITHTTAIEKDYFGTAPLGTQGKP